MNRKAFLSVRLTIVPFNQLDWHLKICLWENLIQIKHSPSPNTSAQPPLALLLRFQTCYNHYVDDQSDVLVMTPVFRLFDVIWCWKMWKYPLVDVLADKSLSSWHRDQIGCTKSSNCSQLSKLLCKCNQTATKMTLIRCQKKNVFWQQMSRYKMSRPVTDMRAS